MPARFALRIESGAQAGETHAIGGAGLTVGRRPGNDLVIGDASVSGRHARFSVEGGRVVMVDLASTNGSFVDDRRVEQATLDGGAFLRIGKVELELVILEGAADDAGEIELEGLDGGDVQGVPAVAPPPAAGSSSATGVAGGGAATSGTAGSGSGTAASGAAGVGSRGADSGGRASAASGDSGSGDPGGELEIEGLEESSFDDDGEGVHRVDAQALAKAKGGPGWLPLVAGVALIGGAAGWYFMGMPGLAGADSGGQAVARGALVIEGNLLADGSFESRAGVAVESAEDEGVELGPWVVEETAQVVPFVAEAWRYGGGVGLGADLDAGARVRVRSAAVGIGRQRGLAAQAWVLSEAGGAGRLGIELFDTAGEHVAFVAWGAAVAGGAVEAAELSIVAPAGYDQARVVLELAAPGPEAGSVGFDDVGLVSAASAGVAVFEDFSLAAMGPDRLALAYIDRPMLVDMLGGAPAVGARGLRFDSRAGRFGASLDPALFAEGLASLGAGGYQPHGDAFEDAGVTSVVIGSGVHQLRLVFEAPVTLTGRPLAVGYRLDAAGVRGSVEIELGFTEERVLAARLDRLAREAEAAGRRGEALGLWQRLLDEVPFDGPLVLGAEAARGRLITQGLAEVAALRGDFERAAFFGLPDLYRDCLAGVEALGDEFAGSEVAGAARELGGEVAAALAAVGGRDAAELRLAEAQRVVLELSREQGFEALAGHIEAALAGGADKEAN